MHTVRAWSVSCAALALGGCMAFNAIHGSGKIVTEPRTVANFSSVSLSGSGQVLIEQGASESLTVTTDDNLLQHVKTEVHGNTLELGVKDPMTNLDPTNDIIFKLTVKQLDRLEISGSGKADIRGLNEDQLQVRISGSGDVSGQGTAGDLDLRISGSGSYRGPELKTRRASIGVSGSGSAVVSASETLDANVSGSGSVEYVGEPHVTQNISGSGSVRRH
jgi:Putative auto-transporter adhesin, head GIN domain